MKRNFFETIRAKKLFYGFRKKLFFAFLAYTLLIVISFIILFIDYMQGYARNNLIKFTNTIISSTKNQAATSILLWDKEYIKSLIDEIIKNENIIYIGVFSTDSAKIFFEKGEKLKKGHFEEERKTLDCKSCHGRKNIYQETKEYFDFAYPVFFKNSDTQDKPIGFIRVIVSKKNINKTLNNAINFGFILGIIFIITGGIISFFLSNMVLNPLSILKKRIDEISKGEADLTKKIELEGKDEFSEIAESFNKFIENLKYNIEKTLFTSEKVKEFSENISSATQELTAASNEVTDTVQKMAGLATDTAAKVIDASRSVKEILELSLSSAEESREMEILEREALNLAQEGRKISEDVSLKLQNMQDNINSLKNNIEGLSKMLKGVTEITVSIQGFMKRTNLLSLNAYIEAARAGEYGKGFTIVAQEIRKLAEDARASSIRIQDIVENIDQGMKDTLVAMIKVTDTLVSARETILKAVTQLKKIADQTEETMERTSKIAQLSLKEREEIEKLAQFMDKVGEMAENVSVSSEEIAASMEEQLASMEQITATVQELAKLGEEISELLGKFKI